MVLLYALVSLVLHATGCPGLEAERGARLRRFDAGAPADHRAFRRLNLEYLEGYVHRAGVIARLLEPQDFVMIDHPVEHVLDPGGAIWLAELPGRAEPVGTVAIRPEGDGDWELSSVAVTPAAQGVGLGRRLVETALAFARAHGARRVVLDSSSTLKAALNLYASLGFVPLDCPRGIYQTADVAMRLDFGRPSE